MCIAAPGKVIAINGKIATVSYMGNEQNAMIMDIVPQISDFVLVQMGIIVKVLSEEESKAAREAWKETE